MNKQKRIDSNEIEVAKKWLIEETYNITKITPCEINALFDLIDLYTAKNAKLYTINNGIDLNGNYLFSSEYDCPNCGKELKSWYKFCPNCGQKITFNNLTQ